MSVVIYMLSEPDTGRIRYVGRTCRLRNRIKAHASQGASAVQAWFLDLQRRRQAPVVTVLEEVGWPTKRRLMSIERRWIKKFRDFGSDLLNFNDGAAGRIPKRPRGEAT